MRFFRIDVVGAACMHCDCCTAIWLRALCTFVTTEVMPPFWATRLLRTGVSDCDAHDQIAIEARREAPEIEMR